MNELVSVIMSVYNEEERWLRKSIESILQQTYANIQFIIVLDNPDNQDIYQILQEYKEKDKRIDLIINEKNIGLVNSLNRALAEVKGKYVARMDADDISCPDRLEKELNFLIEKQADFVMTSLSYIDEEDNPQPTGIVDELCGRKFAKVMKYGNISTHPTWFLKKEIYEKLEGYRQMRHCEDYDFVIRALQENFVCCRMQDILLKYRVRSSGISKSYTMEQKKKAAAIRKAYRQGRLLKRMDVEEINSQHANYSEKAKKRYNQAEEQLELFCNKFAQKKMGVCIGIALKGMFTNWYFGPIFMEYVKSFLAQKA